MSQVPHTEQESGATQFSAERLVAARQQLGLSVEQAATELRLSRQHVEALESADFGKLPSAVFTRGYIRSYARLLNLDADELVRQYDRCYGDKQAPAPIRTVTRVRPRGGSGFAVGGSGLLLLAVIVAATFWWWKTQYGHEPVVTGVPESPVTVDTASGQTVVLSGNEPVAQNTGTAGVTASAAVNATDLTMQSSLAQASVSAAAVSMEQAPASAADSSVVEAGAATDDQAAAPPVAVTHDGLYVRFTGDCWVTVKDANGKTLFNNMRKAGQELQLDQGGPMHLLLGRVSAVGEITFAGSTVDLTPYSNKNVARLTVPVR